jgi:tRNA(fMet)-specific endonuclease VapC
MLRYLLDTDIVIYTIKRRPPQVWDAFNRHADQLGMSTVTLGELIFGAQKSRQPEANLRVVEGLAARLTVLAFDEDAARHFGEIRAQLVSAGCPIGPYDMMIAGHARSRGLVLVTNNRREFDRVPGLRLENWAEG